MLSILETAAWICLAWTAFVVVVQVIGIAATFRFFSHPPPPSTSSRLGLEAPTVTIIRPVKGLEPHLYDCIAATFQQDYPPEKIKIRLCVEHESDPALPVLAKVVDDFPAVDAKILLQSQDPLLAGREGSPALGPNPKIRNVSRAYREAEGDIVWMIDCNVWVSNGCLGRMMDKLVGYGQGGRPAMPYKFVHHMPLVVDVGNHSQARSNGGFLRKASLKGNTPDRRMPALAISDSLNLVRQTGGGRLDEMFMGTSHVKFYGAINAVGIAPCIVGKSNMFRKSHLEHATTSTPSSSSSCDRKVWKPTGVDFFSHNICEDHLIGDALWQCKLPGFRNHGILWGDLVVQPMAGMSIDAYIARRVRWLRARKFTVFVATLVEPGVESLLCCSYAAFALTTLPWAHKLLGVPQDWTAMMMIWLVAVMVWTGVDWCTFRLLHSGRTIEGHSQTPAFAKCASRLGATSDRPFFPWLITWLGRELLALPIWIWAFFLGSTVSWRGKTFRVRLDTSVVDLTEAIRSQGASYPPSQEQNLSAKTDGIEYAWSLRVLAKWTLRKLDSEVLKHKFVVERNPSSRDAWADRKKAIAEP